MAKAGNLSKSPGSDTSGSTVSEGALPIPTAPALTLRNQYPYGSENEADSTSDENSDDDAPELPPVDMGRLPVDAGCRSAEIRPQSSLSSDRYRTPLAGSLAMSPPPQHGIPSQQPLPGFETPSAFAEPTPVSSSSYPYAKPYGGPYSETSRMQVMSPPLQYQSHPSYRAQMQSHPSIPPPPSTSALERAVENVQVHLAALTERLETLESRSLLPSRSNVLGSPRGSGGSPAWAGGRGSPYDRNGEPFWDIDDLGMWSVVLNPLSRGLEKLRVISTFFARTENRSPSMIIIRRLCLDVSFFLCVIALVGAIWRKSGVRRREVKAALVVLWKAVLGVKPDQPHVDRGV